MTSKPHFSIATILVVVVLCAVLLGWYVDHQHLAGQIPVPPKSRSMTYRLSHASAAQAQEKLSELYPENSITAMPSANAILVLADRGTQEQIRLILRYIDRVDTEFIEPDAAMTE